MTGRGTSFCAVWNFRVSRSMLAFQSRAFSEYSAFSLWPVPRVK
jgi:hypothetical protein